MPLSEYFHSAGERVMGDMTKRYGAKKGKSVFHATAQKRGLKPMWAGDVVAPDEELDELGNPIRRIPPLPQPMVAPDAGPPPLESAAPPELPQGPPVPRETVQDMPQAPMPLPMPPRPDTMPNLQQGSRSMAQAPSPNPNDGPPPIQPQGPPPMPRTKALYGAVDEALAKKGPSILRQIAGAALSVSPRLRGVGALVGGDVGRQREMERLKLHQYGANEEQEQAQRQQQNEIALRAQKTRETVGESTVNRNTAQTERALRQPKPAIEQIKEWVAAGYTEDQAKQIVAAGGKLQPQKPVAPPRPISVAPGGTLVDPTTGKATFTAQDREVSAKPQYTGRERLALQAEGLDPDSDNLPPDKVRRALANLRPVRTGRERDAEGDDDLVQRIIKNPTIFDGLTPTEKTRLTKPLARAGFEFGKAPSDTAMTKMSDAKSAMQSMKDLRNVLQANERYIGPIAGLQAMNPWSDSRKAQGDIDRVRQRVGKALEGGVLRKEDEEKYKRILATLTDTPETAIYKIDQMITSFENDLKIYENEQRSGGRRVGSSASTPPQQTPSQAPKVGTVKDGYRFKGGDPSKQSSWDLVKP